tara:strand:- start:478 stop:606 length:129 start_codon:yes stop_codon:yes gene_type:complete
LPGPLAKFDLFLKDFARPLGPNLKYGAIFSEQIKINEHLNKI